MINGTLLKALFALVPSFVLFLGSIVFVVRRKTLGFFLQFVGAGCLVMVGLYHVFEGLNLFPWIGWGLEDSVGHYLDLGSVIVGLTLFPVGYLIQALDQ